MKALQSNTHQERTPAQRDEKNSRMDLRHGPRAAKRRNRLHDLPKTRSQPHRQDRCMARRRNRFPTRAFAMA